MNALQTWIADSPLATATRADWVDIGLLAAVIYWALSVLRGTRALQSLLGLGVVAALYAVSVSAGLSAMHWVLDTLSVYLVLALLILFQDDLRRALAGAGGSLFSRTSRASSAAVLEEVVKASFALASRNIGALVVFERAGHLSDYAHGAHRLDAWVSAELLLAVFHPASPLHDGAVVISGERLMSAGVFLPISLSEDVSRSIGTRHRAAIGLSEVTDALCLVVSEERGTVALVDAGQIVPIADANELRQQLSERLEGRRRFLFWRGGARV